MSVEEVMTKLRASLKRRGAEGIRGLARHFKICDTNKNGTLDQDEFEKCIRLNNLGLSSEETQLLMRFFDRDNSGDVGYEEFLRAVRGRLSPVRKQLVKKMNVGHTRYGQGRRSIRHARYSNRNFLVPPRVPSTNGLAKPEGTLLKYFGRST